MLQKRIERTGVSGAFLLGVLLALNFRPTSAALFFGSLLPLAVKMQSGVILPGIFGIATGIPVFIFAFLLAFGVKIVGKAYDKLAKFEIWAQRITGAVFLLVGLGMTLYAFHHDKSQILHFCFDCAALRAFGYLW